jgi:hypothetical protein
MDLCKLCDLFYKHAQLKSKLRLDHYKPSDYQLDPEIEKKLNKRHLGEVDDFIVYIIDGEPIRNHIDIDFNGAGNPGRYEYCPANEIWIEEFEQLSDIAGYLLHEITEYHLMKDKGLAYDDAHDKASEVELEFRKEMESGDITIESKSDVIREVGKRLSIPNI